MIGIYKITNKKNGKVYIGQSIHIERRFMEHKKPSSHSLIDDAIKSDGEENFIFEVLEECDRESLLDKEIYYINKYNSTVPYGYNVLNGQYNESTNYTYLNKNIVDQIKNDLKKDIYDAKYIADKYQISVSTVSRINNGVVHYLKNEIYPLSKKISLKGKPNLTVCPCCGGYKGKSNNLCFNCFTKNKRNISESIMEADRNVLKLKIRTMPFTKIAEEYSVTDNTIRKWCKRYNLPYRKQDISKFSDQEWESI